MKKLVLLSLVLGLGLMATAQSTLNLKQDLSEHKAIDKMMVGVEPAKASTVVASQEIDTPVVPPTKNTNIVSIINIGTSANAYSYGYGGGQKSIVWAVPELNMVTNFHRMGGELDPGGYSGDLGYDVSMDGGLTWENMIEMYIAENNAGGTYYTDAARYPNHGVWNRKVIPILTTPGCSISLPTSMVPTLLTAGVVTVLVQLILVILPSKQRICSQLKILSINTFLMPMILPKTV